MIRLDFHGISYCGLRQERLGFRSRFLFLSWWLVAFWGLRLGLDFRDWRCYVLSSSTYFVFYERHRDRTLHLAFWFQMTFSISLLYIGFKSRPIITAYLQVVHETGKI